MSDEKTNITIIPALPLRGMSVFPGTLLNFDVERAMSVAALNASLAADQMIFLVAQRDVTKEFPRPDDLYSMGTICRVRQLLRSPGDNHVRVMAEGLSRGRLLRITSESPCYYAEVQRLQDAEGERDSLKEEALKRHCCALFGTYGELTGNQTPGLLMSLSEKDDPGYVADFIAQNIYLRHSEKQKLLEELRPFQRLRSLVKLLSREIEIIGLDQNIQASTQEHIAKNQKGLLSPRAD
jgi:ATP-dependent Lon protease